MLRPASLLVSLLACLVVLTGGPLAGAWADEIKPQPKPKADSKAERPARAPRKPAPPPKLGPPRAGSLRDLGLQMDKLALRIAETVALAGRDPDESVIDIYRGYSLKELKNRKRQVRAKHLVAIMVDPKNGLPLRERAKKVVQGGTLRGDIELSATAKRRGMQERALFCRTEVVDHLKHDDRESRRLTAELLRRWYKVNTVAAILAYKVDEKKTWSRAISAWNKELKRQ